MQFRTEFINDLVSVIIPVYNAERFIKTALTSVINQTYQKMEIIVVDDCSTDNSYNIIKSLMKNNDQIKYYKMEVNSGAAVSRNKAIELAKGRYIAFLDSDDIWHKDKTMQQLKLMNKYNVPISYTSIDIIDEQGILVKKSKNIEESVNYKYILKNTMIPCSSVIVDRELTGDFRMPSLRAGQDYATWLMLMRDGATARGINKSLVQYRKVSGSVSSNKFKSLKKVWGIYRKYEKINIIKSMYYATWFVINALKKHYT